MFQFLSNAFDWLYDFLSALGNFVFSLIDGLVTLFKSFPLILQLTTDSIGYVPSIFAAFISISIVIFIVYLIIGREAGGSE